MAEKSLNQAGLAYLWKKLKVQINGRAPAKHASQHAAGGSDPLTPAAIGAATTAELRATDTKAQEALDYINEMNSLAPAKIE